MRQHFIRVRTDNAVLMINTDHIVSIHAKRKHGQNQTNIEEVYQEGHTLLRLLDGSEVECVTAWDTLTAALEQMEFDMHL